MRNVHIVLLTKTVLNWIKFNSSKQNLNFSKYIPRERGGLPVRADLAPAPKAYSPRTRGSSRLQTLIWQFHSIFPANAGVFLIFFIKKQPPRDIPRERGGHPDTRYVFKNGQDIPRECGGQPTVACPGAGMRTFPCICRGQPASVLLHLTTGIFPAHAGVTLLYIVSTDIRVLYSPRTRGSSHKRDYMQYISYIFPAHAGVFLIGAVEFFAVLNIPRECGG